MNSPTDIVRSNSSGDNAVAFSTKGSPGDENCSKQSVFPPSSTSKVTSSAAACLAITCDPCVQRELEAHPYELH
jgi:hypothetical protein